MGQDQLCLVNSIFKIITFRRPIEVPSKKKSNCPDGFSPVSAVTSTGSPRCSAATCVSSSCLLGGKIEANSIEPGYFLQKATKLLQCKHFSYGSTLNTTWHLIFESIPEVVTLSSQRRTAKLSGLSGFKPCAALNRNGMAKAARAGHTRRYAKLAAETAKHRKLQECKVLTYSCLSDGKRPRLLWDLALSY